jgi:erythromycin esterase-like protein
MQYHDIDDFTPILRLASPASVVLIGEASHGTEEFYAIRAELTKRLIVEQGFQAVAVEADWPDAYRANRWVRGSNADNSAEAALSGFERFPRWMWRNSVVSNFLTWLRSYNERSKRPAGFYGIDLYSLHASRKAVIDYLETVDPEAAKRARNRYSCFDHFRDPQDYGYHASLGLGEPCQTQVLQQLLELQRQSSQYTSADGVAADDEYFYARQNAVLVKNAEEYYRTMFGGRVSSWNLRDRHMFETLTALRAHLSSTKAPAKVVVWAHNSHLGDARATEMARWGELNLGQLVREHHGDDSLLIAFSTYTGTVRAADDWGGSDRVMTVRPGLRGSYEDLFHRERESAFIIPIRGHEQNEEFLSEPRLQRAIGVIYRPDTERTSHYFEANLAKQFDALIYLDETRALQPLVATKPSVPEEVPETFPSGM